MCLHAITKRIKTPSDREVTAWKLFRVSASGNVRYYYRHGRVRTDGWRRAGTRSAITSSISGVYYSGFHAWSSKRTAEKVLRACRHRGSAELIRVRLRRVRTVGTQEHLPFWKMGRVLVADEMYVPQPAVRRK